MQLQGQLYADRTAHAVQFEIFFQLKFIIGCCNIRLGYGKMVGVLDGRSCGILMVDMKAVDMEIFRIKILWGVIEGVLVL